MRWVSSRTTPRFTTTVERFNHYQELIDLVAVWAASRTTAEIIAILDQADVPASPYRAIDSALEDPQLLHRGMLAEVIDAAGPLTVPNTPMLFSSTQAAVQPWVAKLGEHTDEVLMALGVAASERAALKESGAVGAKS